MRRTVWMIVSLVAVVLWLVLSYAPGVSLPVLAYPAGGGPLLAALAAVGLLAFLAIQGWIVWSTDRAVVGAGKVAAAEMGVRRGRELFWTMLPLAITLAIGAAAAGLWQMLR
jgi:hypothetical protein